MKGAMKKATFFLRFYGQPKESIEKYAEEYKRMFPSCIGYEIRALTSSVNLLVPKASWEVFVKFSDEAKKEEAYSSVEGKKWYMARAYLKPGAKFVAQKPGSKVWNNPVPNK